MLGFAHKQKLTVPNSLALAAAAVLVWSTNGASTGLNDLEASCTSDSTNVSSTVSLPETHVDLPSMRATPEQCGNYSEQQQGLQAGDAVAKSVRTAGFRLLYLPAKALLHR